MSDAKPVSPITSGMTPGEPSERVLHTGICTLLLTDVEESTSLWERDRDAAADALALHDSLAGRIVAEHGGTVIKARGEGDSLFCVFQLASDAVSAALALQRGLLDTEWPPNAALKVRMAIHTGEVEARDGDLYGPTINRCARMRSAAHGGQILVSQAAQQLASDSMPPEAGWAELGSHRLRDLSRPERLFQLTHPAIARNFPPIRTLEYRANNLPVLLTAFIGRTRELAEIGALLTDSRLVTLIGPGGTGKTRLALHVASDALDQFRDGVCFVDLAPIRSGEHVEPAILSAIASLRLGTASDLYSAVADRRLLIVLDNCEHLLDAAVAWADRLLAASPESSILATSRSGLGLPGERLYPVPPMAAPKPGERGLLKKLQASDAGRLFYDRARAVMPGFTLNSENVEYVAAICAALDGIPLALELAAARLRVLSPLQIKERLQDRFGLLTSTGQTEDRHRTLRSTLDWSFDLLSLEEKGLLISLAIFRGGWTLEAAEAICATDALPGGQVLDALQALVEKSMVVFEPSDSGYGRFTLLESVREYAGEKAAKDERTAQTEERHTEWFHQMVLTAEPHLTGTDQARWFERIERDLDNIRCAIERLAQSEAGRPAALQMALALRTFWIVRGHYSEAIAWIGTSLESGATLEPALRSRAWNVLGILSMLGGDLDGSIGHFENALSIRRETGDVAGQAAVLSNLGIVERYLFRFGAAIKLFEESVRLYRNLDDPNGFSYALLNLGCAYFDTGVSEKAVPLYEECEALMTRMGDRSGLSQLMVNQADAARALGDGDRAKERLLSAIREGEACGYTQSLGDGFISLGRLALSRGQPATAAVAFGAARSIMLASGAKPTPIDERHLSELGAAIAEMLDPHEFAAETDIGMSVPERGRFELARQLLERVE